MILKNYLIYKHTSPSGRSYIGQTKNITKRNQIHKNPNNGCRAISKAIQKYGFDNFTHEILAENLTIEEANILEEKFIKEYNTLAPNGYNLHPGGLNHTCLEETKQKLSRIHLGKPKTNKHKANISKARTGTTRSEETKQKQSQNSYNKGKPAYNKGIPHTKEHNQKLSIARKGIIISEKTKQKNSASHMGKKLSKETIEKRTETRRKNKEIKTEDEKFPSSV